ncbi:Arc family DNA-binding protein [Cereibacter azotoformans]|uniref:Arc family DNA-binding protein n=1 Tax=Cereibacter azotoformans TaxID=43057 RepID=UPI001956C270|nr:Arc family DNA-binding protein [Cereibacter azotoformans]
MTRQFAEQFVLRMPDGLRDRIKVTATINRRSMNAEILYHLERALDAAPSLPSDPET